MLKSSYRGYKFTLNPHKPECGREEKNGVITAREGYFTLPFIHSTLSSLKYTFFEASEGVNPPKIAMRNHFFLPPYGNCHLSASLLLAAVSLSEDDALRLTASDLRRKHRFFHFAPCWRVRRQVH